MKRIFTALLLSASFNAGHLYASDVNSGLNDIGTKAPVSQVNALRAEKQALNLGDSTFGALTQRSSTQENENTLTVAPVTAAPVTAAPLAQAPAKNTAEQSSATSWGRYVAEHGLGFVLSNAAGQMFGERFQNVKYEEIQAALKNASFFDGMRMRANMYKNLQEAYELGHQIGGHVGHVAGRIIVIVGDHMVEGDLFSLKFLKDAGTAAVSSECKQWLLRHTEFLVIETAKYIARQGADKGIDAACIYMFGPAGQVMAIPLKGMLNGAAGSIDAKTLGLVYNMVSDAAVKAGTYVAPIAYKAAAYGAQKGYNAAAYGATQAYNLGAYTAPIAYKAAAHGAHKGYKAASYGATEAYNLGAYAAPIAAHGVKEGYKAAAQGVSKISSAVSNWWYGKSSQAAPAA